MWHDFTRISAQRQDQLEKGIKQQKLQLVQLNAQIASLETQITAETERNSSVTVCSQHI